VTESDSSTSNMALDESAITRIQPALMVAPRVLLVDDDEIVIERLRDLIVAAGYEVITATNGTAALALLQSDFAPIVILDLNMPGMDGLELCRQIRGGPHYPGYVYIMLCTARDSEDEILAGLNAGADDYLSKRSSGTQLIARLATARRIIALEHSLKVVIAERRQMALSDALTGAHNRRHFMTHMRREMKRSCRGGYDLALLIFDIDHFKRINDRFGHSAGDAVLMEFVRRTRESLPREEDWCARLGGEEFAVVLPRTDLTGGEVVAERIRRAISGQPFAMAAGNLSVTVSAGVSNISVFADRGAVELEQLLHRADECLYFSKNHGRDRVTVDGRLPVSDKTLKSVLYVDDDPDIREIVEMALGLDGELRVLTSDGGERALLKMRVEKPDLVVLDVMMPGMDGPTLLKRMRLEPELARIPVIFMTAKSSKEDSERLRDLSAIGVIAKPFDPMALGGQVKALWTAQ
jgi:two-component system, cell cycle response regulator